MVNLYIGPGDVHELLLQLQQLPRRRVQVAGLFHHVLLAEYTFKPKSDDNDKIMRVEGGE